MGVYLVPVPGSEYVEPSWEHQRESRMYKSPTRDPQDHVSGSLVEIIPSLFSPTHDRNSTSLIFPALIPEKSGRATDP